MNYSDNCCYSEFHAVAIFKQLKVPLIIVCLRNYAGTHAVVFNHKRAVTLTRVKSPARNFLSCWHFGNTSLLLFRRLFLTGFRICSFLLSRRLQFFDPVEYAFVCFTMDHLIWNAQLRCLSAQTYFHSSVSFR